MATSTSHVHACVAFAQFIWASGANGWSPRDQAARRAAVCPVRSMRGPAISATEIRAVGVPRTLAQPCIDLDVLNRGLQAVGGDRLDPLP